MLFLLASIRELCWIPGKAQPGLSLKPGMGCSGSSLVPQGSQTLV